MDEKSRPLTDNPLALKGDISRRSSGSERGYAVNLVEAQPREWIKHISIRP